MAIEVIQVEVPRPGMVSVTEVARRADVNRAYVGELVKSGKLDAVRVVGADGTVLATWLDGEAVERWLKLRRPRRSPS